VTGPLLTEDDVQRIMDFWCDQASPRAEMFGAGWPVGTPVNFYDEEGWLEKPLPAGQTWTWEQRERRVEWCVANLTAGEKAYLYRLLHDGDGLRRAACDEVVRKEKTCVGK